MNTDIFGSTEELVHKLYKLNYPKEILIDIINTIFSRSFPNSLPNIAELLMKEGDFELSLKYCTLGLKTLKDDKLLFMKGICHFNLNEFLDCINTLKDISSDEYTSESIELINICSSKLNIC
jgi:hypothetical protein